MSGIWTILAVCYCAAGVYFVIVLRFADRSHREFVEGLAESPLEEYSESRRYRPDWSSSRSREPIRHYAKRAK